MPRQRRAGRSHPPTSKSPSLKLRAESAGRAKRTIIRPSPSRTTSPPFRAALLAIWRQQGCPSSAAASPSTANTYSMCSTFWFHNWRNRHQRMPRSSGARSVFGLAARTAPHPAIQFPELSRCSADPQSRGTIRPRHRVPTALRRRLEIVRLLACFSPPTSSPLAARRDCYQGRPRQSHCAESIRHRQEEN